MNSTRNRAMRMHEMVRYMYSLFQFLMHKQFIVPAALFTKQQLRPSHPGFVFCSRSTSKSSSSYVSSGSQLLDPRERFL